MITINGLENNGYLVNNKVLVSIATTDLIRSCILRLTDLHNLEMTPNFELSPDPFNNVVFDLAQPIKALLKSLQNNTNYTSTSDQVLERNFIKVDININVNYIDGTSDGTKLTKTFVRGGVFDHVNESKTIAPNSLLSPTEKIPVFLGYPVAGYKVNSDFQVVKHNRASFNNQNIPFEIMKAKTCNGAYLKFLNSLGGYSYWLFEDLIEDVSTSQLGIVENIFGKKDLGSNHEMGLRVIGKVPKRYNLLMRDLVTSPQIYLWQNNEWKQIWNDNNKWSSNSNKEAFKVDYKFVFFNNQNRSLRWN